MQYHNVHSHVFTMNNAPKRFLHLYLPGFAASAIDNITNTRLGAWVVKGALNLVGGNGGKRYASFLAIGKSKNQLQVFENLKAQYDDPNMKFVALTLNMEFCGAGNSTSGYEGQLDEVLQVKRQYPESVNVFLGIDPRWKPDGKALLDVVKKYFETPLKINDSRSVNAFCGIKIYPSMGFYPFDERLTETFAWAEQNEVPVLSHCSYLGGIYNNDTNYIKNNLNRRDPYTGNMYTGAYIKEKNFGRWVLGTTDENNNVKSCSYFMEPIAFDSLLNRFKKLKICLAHFGGDNQIKDSITGTKTPAFGNAKQNWFLQMKAMMQQHKNLYTDISYGVHNKDIFNVFLNELNDTGYGNRVMFGTDYFLTEREKEEKNTFTDFRETAKATTLSNNGNANAWDNIAGKNVDDFLKGRFYP